MKWQGTKARLLPQAHLHGFLWLTWVGRSSPGLPTALKVKVRLLPQLLRFLGAQPPLPPPSSPPSVTLCPQGPVWATLTHSVSC